MIYVVIISGISFTIGNVFWGLAEEPKLFYVPLAVFLMSLLAVVKKNISTNNKYLPVFIEYLFLLSIGNIIKQVFYTETISQINDYVWGAGVTVWLIYKIGTKWAIPTTQSGMKSGKDSLKP